MPNAAMFLLLCCCGGTSDFCAGTSHSPLHGSYDAYLTGDIPNGNIHITLSAGASASPTEAYFVGQEGNYTLEFFLEQGCTTFAMTLTYDGGGIEGNVIVFDMVGGLPDMQPLGEWVADDSSGDSDPGYEPLLMIS